MLISVEYLCLLVYLLAKFLVFIWLLIGLGFVCSLLARCVV